MKKLILIVLLLVPLTAFGVSFNCKRPPKPKVMYYLLDPAPNVDLVFKIVGSRIRHVAEIYYLTYEIKFLEGINSMRTFGEAGDDPTDRRKALDDAIRTGWPGVTRLKVGK